MDNKNEGVAARTTSTVSAPGVSFDAAGHECMSEDECIAAGVNFAGYERGVADAIDACEKLAKLRASTSTASAPSQTQSAPISTPAIGASHSDPLAAANAGGLAGTVNDSLLPDMTYSMDGIPVGSPGWHARSGWNSAVIHLGDRLRPAAAGADVVGWQNRMAPDQIVEGKNPPDRSDKWVPLVYAADRAPATKGAGGVS